MKNERLVRDFPNAGIEGCREEGRAMGGGGKKEKEKEKEYLLRQRCVLRVRVKIF